MRPMHAPRACVAFLGRDRYNIGGALTEHIIASRVVVSNRIRARGIATNDLAEADVDAILEHLLVGDGSANILRPVA